MSRARRSACHAAAQRGVASRARRAAGARASAASSSRDRRASVVDRRLGVVRRCSRRSASAAARWNAWLRGANGRGSSIVATVRSGPRKSCGRRAARASRPAVSASTRLPPRPRSCFSTTTRPPRRGAITTSPGRSASSRGRVARPRAVAARRVELGERARRYSSTSPRRGRAAALGARELLAAALELALERDDVAVGVELREREVEQVVGLFGRVAAHEVGGHVVRRAERRRERVRAARREPGDLVERHERVPAARRRSRRRRCPRRPARPVSCVYSPGVRNSWCSPVNFESFSMTTERAGMLMPSDSVSVANTTFTSPAANASSTASFIGGTMPGVVRGEAGLEARRATRRSRARRGRRR